MAPGQVAADGSAMSSLHRRDRSIEFKKFLAKINANVPATSTST